MQHAGLSGGVSCFIQSMGVSQCFFFFFFGVQYSHHQHHLYVFFLFFFFNLLLRIGYFRMNDSCPIYWLLIKDLTKILKLPFKKNKNKTSLLCFSTEANIFACTVSSCSFKIYKLSRASMDHNSSDFSRFLRARFYQHPWFTAVAAPSFFFLPGITISRCTRVIQQTWHAVLMKLT